MRAVTNKCVFIFLFVYLFNIFAIFYIYSRLKDISGLLRGYSDLLLKKIPLEQKATILCLKWKLKQKKIMLRQQEFL